MTLPKVNGCEGCGTMAHHTSECQIGEGDEGEPESAWSSLETNRDKPRNDEVPRSDIHWTSRFRVSRVSRGTTRYNESMSPRSMRNW